MNLRKITADYVRENTDDFKYFLVDGTGEIIGDNDGMLFHHVLLATKKNHSSSQHA